mmetsp:Transcript_87975/g.278153  ORF Transcript_87975/g.278153 Transcript_87975/m.278153 type:complete len:534 (-) Transcript_87975:86-1687(-)
MPFRSPDAPGMELAVADDAAKALADAAGTPGSGNDILQGVAKVLWEASAALARLGASGGALSASEEGSGTSTALVSQPPVDPLGLFPDRGPGSQEAGTQLANAASALAQAAAALKLGEGGALVEAGSESAIEVKGEEEEEDEPCMTSTEFIETHNLDPWVGEALDMLSSSQCAAVINPPLNMERARNPNGVIVSRIKQVAPVDQRIQMFIKVNDLAEGVVDRLSTLTPEQCEAVMETGLKIQKATNPSGVAMKRITEVLKSTNPRGGGGRINLVSRHDAGPVGGGGRMRGRYDSPGARRYHDRGRSYSRGRGQASGQGRSSYGGGGAVASGMPSDVLQAMEELRLEDWCGEVLRRLSLWQRQTVIREIGTMRSVRNPSGVVMSRIRAIAKTDELLAIFVDINGLDRSVEDKLWDLTPEQRAAVMAPGIFLQNVRNPSVAVRSRISNVVEGRSAMQRPPWRRDGRDNRDDKGSGREDSGRDVRRGRSSEHARNRDDRRQGSRARKRARAESSSDDGDEDDDDDSPRPTRRRRTR